MALATTKLPCAHPRARSSAIEPPAAFCADARRVATREGRHSSTHVWAREEPLWVIRSPVGGGTNACRSQNKGAITAVAFSPVVRAHLLASAPYLIAERAASVPPSGPTGASLPSAAALMLRPRSQSAVLLFCASCGGDGHRDALMPSTPLRLRGTSVAAPPVTAPSTSGPRPPPLSPHYPSRRPLVPAVCRLQCQRPPRRKASSSPCNRLRGQRNTREGAP